MATKTEPKPESTSPRASRLAMQVPGVFMLVGFCLAIAQLIAFTVIILAGGDEGRPSKPTVATTSQAKAAVTPQATPEPARNKDVSAKPGKIMKLPRYKGSPSPIAGRITDEYAGISYANLRGLWGPNRAKSEDDLASDDQHSREQQFRTEKTWVALLRSGRASAAVLGGFKGKNKLLNVALAYMDEFKDNSFPDNTTHRDVVSQPLTVGSKKAWILGREMHYDKSADGYKTKMELSTVVVIDTGDPRPALALISIPDTQKSLRPDINHLIDSIRLL